jgi:hypothetical protein
MGWLVARMEDIRNSYRILIVKILLKRLTVRSRDEKITLICAIRKLCRLIMGLAEDNGLL